MTTFSPKLLGRKVEHDPKSWDFRIERTSDVKSVEWRTYGAVLNQGNLGSCTGNALAGALNSDPLHQKSWGVFKEKDAVHFYSLNTQHDEWPNVQYPPTDCGSSGLAAAKTAQQLGYITRYEHAMGIEDALSAIQRGPLICGTAWLANMEDTDENGLLDVSGREVGGHEYLMTGFDADKELLHFRNSWGRSWGKSGTFYMKVEDFSKLLKEQGDVTLLLR